MSTRSRIAYLDEGIVKSVYCHFDGYLSGVGRTLVQNYRTLDKVKELISLGSISALGKSTEYSEDLENGTKDYHRWRGEEIEIETDYGVQDFVQSGFDCGEDYIYLFVPFMDMGDWYYLEYNGSWRKVADALADDTDYFLLCDVFGQPWEMLYFPEYADRDDLQSDVDRFGERFEKIKDAYGFVNGLEKHEYILECLRDCYRFDIVPWSNDDKVFF